MTLTQSERFLVSYPLTDFIKWNIISIILLLWGGGVTMNPIVDLPEPLLLGLHALGELMKHPGCHTTRHLAEAVGANTPSMSKILQRLQKGGIIRAVRGPGGGYVLDCVPEDTPLYPIFELLSGPDHTVRRCRFCNEKPCFITNMCNELADAFFRYLQSRTLADFALYYKTGMEVSIEISVVTPSLGQKHPNFEKQWKQKSNKKQ